MWKSLELGVRKALIYRKQSLRVHGAGILEEKKCGEKHGTSGGRAHELSDRNKTSTHVSSYIAFWPRIWFYSTDILKD